MESEALIKLDDIEREDYWKKVIRIVLEQYLGGDIEGQPYR